ncbi:MAG: transcriptional repressor LexA [Gammaproteobacteria bacterium]|nr:transcriptional repressor LexA [Gammaproteobacteria bacterium]
MRQRRATRTNGPVVVAGGLAATRGGLYILPVLYGHTGIQPVSPQADLTPRQLEIFEFLQRFMSETGMPPTRADMARELGFRSANAAEEHLRALERKGVIELLPGRSRGIRLLPAGLAPDLPAAAESDPDEEGLPLVGRVAAGQPILAAEHIEARYRLDLALFNPRPHYLLRVQGMSMRDAGILDGDLVAVRREPDVRNGQIVVARLEEEVTVKRYRQAGTTVTLLPHNPDFEPIRVDLKAEHLVIEGVVVGVIRSGLATAA